MGRNIGSITEELGFIPNNNFNADDEITTLDFGQYAIALENSKSVMDALLAVFINVIMVSNLFDHSSYRLHPPYAFRHGIITHPIIPPDTRLIYLPYT